MLFEMLVDDFLLLMFFSCMCNNDTFYGMIVIPMFHHIIQLHKNLFFLLHTFALKNSQLHNFIVFIADKLDTYVIILAMATLFYFTYISIEHTSWKRLRFLIAEGIRIFTSVCLAWIVSYLVKNLTKLPRPFLRYPHEVTQLFDYGGFNSFPSGHATLFMAVAVMIVLHHKHVGYLFIFFAVIISIARVMSGIHFPVDIIVGWILGGIIALLVYRALKGIT